jgi:hypothetical protein
MNTYYIGGMPVTDELYHHGILGQKWGVRRYQNPDGTLTPAGKKRYYGISESTDIGDSGGTLRAHYKVSNASPGNSASTISNYRNKYGEETDEGKKRSESYTKRFLDSTKIGPSGLRTHESIEKFYSDEESRIKKLFEKSSDPRLHDPKAYDKVMDIWNKTLFEAYDSNYGDVANTEEYKTLKKLEKQSENAYKKTVPLFEKYRETWQYDNPKLHDKAYKEYKNSEEYRNLEKIQDEIRKTERQLSGMKKMRTMDEIMKMITPEMRDDVYDYLSDMWNYD